MARKIAGGCWAGVDVGGRSKGFHVAVVDGQRVRARHHELDVSSVVALLEQLRPRVVGIDSPSTPAPDGDRSRTGERELGAAGVCGVRYTPDRSTLHAPHRTNYYDWILRGFELYSALEKAATHAGWKVIEVFPTASWSQWAGRRKGSSRAVWSRKALADRGLHGVPSVSSQDDRDAIAAAITAQLYPRGTVSFGEIVVPKPSSDVISG